MIAYTITNVAKRPHIVICVENCINAGTPLESKYSREVMNKSLNWVISRLFLTLAKVFHDILIQKYKGLPC